MILKKNYLSVYAKSFNWAGFFLPKQTYNECSALYNFCRIIDNIADEKNTLSSKKEKFTKFKEDFYSKKFSDDIIQDMHWKECDVCSTIQIINLPREEDVYLKGHAAGIGKVWEDHNEQFIRFIEKNKPATFKYPLWSLIGDHHMAYLMLTGKLKKKLSDAGVSAT